MVKAAALQKTITSPFVAQILGIAECWGLGLGTVAVI